MTTGQVRDTMEFRESWTVRGEPGRPVLDVRLYATRRPGTYGTQFAACVWTTRDGYASSKTGGCGYDKASAAVAEALGAAAKAEGREFAWHKWSGTGQIEEAIADFLGVEFPKDEAGRDDWRAFNAWRDAEVFHAHG